MGFRIRLNGISSLGFELRKSVFVHKYTGNSVSYRDTTLLVNGKLYHNTIGEVSPVQLESPDNIFSLGMGYRMTFVEKGTFIPFAEVLIGASTRGGGSLTTGGGRGNET